MRAQTWYLEFIVAIVIVAVMGTIFLQTLLNQHQGSSIANLHTRAVRVSESLMTPGYPLNWTQDDVRTIGVVQQWHVNESKMENFYNLTSGQIRVALNLQHHYHIGLYNRSTPIRFDDKDFVGEVIPDARKVASVKRFVVYNQTIMQLQVTLWQ
jgi:hypothetical protein